MRILFVCSGNICRSPMAAEYARHRAAQAGISHLLVDSAGTLGITGAPASEAAVQVLREAGLDLTSHRSRGLRKSDMTVSDLILVMEHDHLAELEHRFPGREDGVYLLRAFDDGPDPAHGAPDLDDPIQMPLDDYRARFAEIRTAVDHLMIHLRHAG
jgi:protein-tyrosine-phosphatase